jgi:hypothetical protein
LDLDSGMMMECAGAWDANFPIIEVILVDEVAELSGEEER